MTRCWQRKGLLPSLTTSRKLRYSLRWNWKETLEQGITRCREQTEELERRYGELEGKLDAEDLKGFEPWREKWSKDYEKKAAERIRKRKGSFRMYLFERAVQNTGYSLRHGAYLAGRAAYVVKEMVQAAEETDGQGRKR